MHDLGLFHGPNAGYVLDLYERFQRDPQSVDEQTRAIFAGWTPAMAVAADGAAPPAAARLVADTPVDVTHTVAAARLIRYIRESGHLAARIDPLGSTPLGDPGLELAIHDVTEDQLRQLPASMVRGPLVAECRHTFDGVLKLREVYCGSIGYETDHVHNYWERTWIREAAESRLFFEGIGPQRQRELLERLTEVEVFERFLHQTFTGQKRFSIEGCDMLVPMLDSIIRNAAAAGNREVVIGMAHRGRLNVLAHVLGKPYAALLSEFLKSHHDDGAATSGKGTTGWTGDVKYHLGARRAYRDAGVEAMPITLAPNPSHLEFVNPVVMGRARAAQERHEDAGPPRRDPKASLAILLHGDAAFPGQGIVAETLNLSGLRGYSVGGTIHIIINNQIGFTTSPREARSTLYASDLAKGFEIPIVHVNADDVVACIAVARMASAYREKFGKDFVIDLVGYRRWGHNEGDEPAFTQPHMYGLIQEHPTVRASWAARLETEGVIQPGEGDQLVARVHARLQQAYADAEALLRQPASEAFLPPRSAAPAVQTAVSPERLVALNTALLERPAGFTPHVRLERTLQRRRQAVNERGGIDWAHAESLAFASLLVDGTPIRLTGQDVERGTFSHRHLVLHDTVTGNSFVPLHHVPGARAAFAIYNSSLSENAALGFEYGYSMHAPNVLVLWEAQFGDFANGAQVIIDQFLVSGRAKWGQTPSLVLLLPHGYEGQGPEHSSARLERYLQLAARDNIRVAYPTTAAQYFHLLRRQAAFLETDPRPLIVMSPKSLLRHPRAGSSLQDLSEGQFQPLLVDPIGDPAAISRLILCSGKVYVDLMTSPAWGATEGVAVARLEELYPFPEAAMQALLARLPELHEVVWLQEEPANQGAYHFVAPHLRSLLPAGMPLLYAGRAESASTAEGSLGQHLAEQARLIAAALHGVSTAQLT